MQVNRRVLLGGLAMSVLNLRSRFSAAATEATPLQATTITAAETSVRLAGSGSPSTSVWAFEGVVPGPLIRIRQGSELSVELVNKLVQPTSLSWPGMRIDNAFAGISGLTQAPVQPGSRFTYRFRARDAGLFWYHPAVWPHTAEQVGRGLFGAVIVDEIEPPPSDADYLLVLHDWLLGPDGQISGGFAAADRIGPMLAVNGMSAPASLAIKPGARLRLRVLNACSARIAFLRIDGAMPTVIAIDGQPSELFQPARNVVPVGPGSRVELMLDMPARPEAASVVLLGEKAAEQPLLRIAVAGGIVAARGAVTHLPANPALPTRIALEKAQRVALAIGSASSSGQSSRAPATGAPAWAWTVNGAASDGISGRPLFTASKGAVVVLTVENRTSIVQQITVGGHVFRVLHDLDDGWDPYWRNTIIVLPGKAKHLAMVVDNPGRWLVASSMLNRQVSGLAAHFVVADSAVVPSAHRKAR